MKIFSKLLAMFILFSVSYSCNSEDDSGENETNNPEGTVDNITFSMEHIITPIQGQPEARYMKFNMLNDRMYFQELTGNSWTENARLWEYNVTTNQYALKMARGTSFSWSGWGIKLFNLNGNMYHIDQTGEPSVEYYQANTDDWTGIITTVPDYIIAGDAAVSGQHVYFLGGTFANYFTSYDAADTWYSLASFPINIENPVMVADENYVYSLGGRQSENGGSDDNYFAKYSIQDNEWEILPTLPHAAYGTNYGNKAVIVDDRYLVVITSEEANASLLDVYDIQENVWKSESLFTVAPVSYMYEHNGTLYFISSTYNEQTETITCRLYEGTLENLPN